MKSQYVDVLVTPSVPVEVMISHLFGAPLDFDLTNTNTHISISVEKHQVGRLKQEVILLDPRAKFTEVKNKSHS